MTLSIEEKALKFDKMSQDRKAYNIRRNAKNNLLVQKAIENGIVVSDKEIDEYLENKNL